MCSAQAVYPQPLCQACEPAPFAEAHLVQTAAYLGWRGEHDVAHVGAMHAEHHTRAAEHLYGLRNGGVQTRVDMDLQVGIQPPLGQVVFQRLHNLGLIPDVA
eukprot:scaffold146_cov374-Prasinococcus_capsulatus_cf.AAC.7